MFHKDLDEERRSHSLDLMNAAQLAREGDILDERELRSKSSLAGITS